MVNLTFTTMTFSQDIGSDWINVRGKSTDQIENLMNDQIRILRTYDAMKVKSVEERLNKENDIRITTFSDKKIDLRDNLDNATDNKNDLAIEVNNINRELNDRKSNLTALEQKIIDADSSSNRSLHLIQGEKNRVEEELTKIPFFDVMISRIKEIPDNAQNIGEYDDKLTNEIFRSAIENQLGLDIINETIISDNTLTKEQVKILLKGRANGNLTMRELQNTDKNTGLSSFDRIRFGLVSVFPFLENDIDLSPVRSINNVNTDVETIKDINQGITNLLSDTDKRKIKSLLSQKREKNSDSERQIKRLASTSKQLIDQENYEINRNKRIVDDINNQIKILKPEIVATESNLIKAENELNVAIGNFNLAKKNYDNHIFNESYVDVFMWDGYLSQGKNKSDTYVELGIESFHEFLSSIRSEYIKEETESIGDGYSEIIESKKSDVLINEIKFMGKFAETRGTRTNLVIYIAYKYGFEFEQATDTPISGAIKTTSSKSEFSSFTKQERPLKPKDNLKITSKPSGANVFVSGRKIGVTPLSTYFDPGTYNLAFKKEGYQPGMDLITIKESGLTRSKTRLKRTAVADKTEKQDNGPSLFSKKNMIMAGGGIAILGGALLLLNQDEEETQQTGSVSISINIP